MDYVTKLYNNWRFNTKFTELVSQMDEEKYMNEKQSIRESSRSLKKYGSTCNHRITNSSEVLIRHEIEKTDTLQGISLKYGCSTEQIRRANRLFASDSLFLREFLMIPVEKNSPYYPKDDRPQSLPVQPKRAASIDGYPSKNQPNSQSMENVLMSPDEENKKFLDEFLGKIDSSIAESKKFVVETRKNNDFPSDLTTDDMFSNGSQQKYRAHSISSSSSTSYQNYNPSTASSGGASTSAAAGGTNHHQDAAHLNAITQGRRVQNSLQRHERQQDEMFEL